MINATFDNGRSSKSFTVLVSSLCFKLLGKAKNVNFKLIPNQDLFMLVPISRMVNLASIKLNGEPMQEIHQI